MIYAVDRNEAFRTYWHVQPPVSWAEFQVCQDMWVGNARHVYAWRYPDLPVPDSQGWLPVPAWWRDVAV